MIRRLLGALRRSGRRPRLKAGDTVSRFLAPDVRRDVEIVDVSEIEQGYLVARIRTWNLLHVSKGLAPMPAFSEPRRLGLDALWQWKGAAWGGPVPPD